MMDSFMQQPLSKKQLFIKPYFDVEMVPLLSTSSLHGNNFPYVMYATETYMLKIWMSLMFNMNFQFNVINQLAFLFIRPPQISFFCKTLFIIIDKYSPTVHLASFSSHYLTYCIIKNLF